MKLDYQQPRDYNFREPMFNERGRITSRVRNGLENVLSAYSKIAKMHAIQTDNNLVNYLIKEVSVVGSGTRNKVNSDLDLLLIAPDLDEGSAKNISLVLAMIYFTDRQKQEAIDVHLRQKDIFPDRPEVRITDQVKKILKKYNKRIK